MGRNTYHVLWTGGLDSSYTMMLFSKYEIVIQPYHILSGRRSEKQEIRAIREITTDILANAGTRAEIRPLIMIDTKDIPENKKITKAYQALKSKNSIGIQYEWIARFAWDQEIDGFFYSSVKSHSAFSRAQGCIEDNGELMDGETPDGILVRRVNPEKSNENLMLVFGKLRFPKSSTLLKAEEVEEMKKLGFEKSIKKTWFCHQPILGHPCGICHPCQEVFDNGLEWRMSSAAKKRFQRERSGVDPKLNRFTGYITAPFER